MRSQGGLSLAQTFEQDAVRRSPMSTVLDAPPALRRDDRKNVEIDVGVPAEHVFRMALS